MEKQNFSDSDKLNAEVAKLEAEAFKLEAEAVYLVSRSKTEVPKLFAIGAGSVISLGGLLLALIKFIGGA